MLPLNLLNACVDQPISIELKNGDTYNGDLVSCDHFMNLNLKNVVCTSRDGDKFVEVAKCYVRGNTIKYLRILESLIDKVEAQEKKRNASRGGRGSRGRGGNSRGRGNSSRGRGKGRGGSSSSRGNNNSRGRGRGKGKTSP